MTDSNGQGVPTVPSVLSLLELGGRIVLLVVAFLYALGFVIITIHLARFNYFALTLFDRRYAFAGFWALSPLMLFLLYMRILRYSERPKREAQPVSRWRRWGGQVSGWALSVPLFYAVQNALAQLFGASMSSPLWLAFIYGGGILFFFVTRKAVHRWRQLTAPSQLNVDRSQVATSGWNVARSVLSEISWVWTPVVVTYFVLFTYLLFPQIPARWGGGSPQTVQLVFAQDETPALSALGIARSTPQLSEPVTLVATTDEMYVLLLDTTRVAYVRRDVIRAVTLQGHFSPPLPIRFQPAAGPR